MCVLGGGGVLVFFNKACFIFIIYASVTVSFFSEITNNKVGKCVQTHIILVVHFITLPLSSPNIHIAKKEIILIG